MLFIPNTAPYAVCTYLLFLSPSSPWWTPLESNRLSQKGERGKGKTSMGESSTSGKNFSEEREKILKFGSALGKEETEHWKSERQKKCLEGSDVDVIVCRF